MAQTENATVVTDNVYRCGSDRVNWYLIEAEEGVTIVDTGYPTHWKILKNQLDILGHTFEDIKACLLTHAHPDHIGFADRLYEKTNVPIWIHADDVDRGRAGGDPPVGGFVKNLWRPTIIRYFIEIIRSNGTATELTSPVTTFEHGDVLDVPGGPKVIYTPGHTAGEVAFHFPDHGILTCGDTLATVTFETFSGNQPQLLPSWLNADHQQARESLSKLESIGSVILLPGHGDPWTGSMSEAVTLARES